MTGLLPGTTYYYRYGDNSTGWSSVRSFVASPAEDAARPTIIAAFGDMGQVGFSLSLSISLSISIYLSVSVSVAVSISVAVYVRVCLQLTSPPLLLLLLPTTASSTTTTSSSTNSRLRLTGLSTTLGTSATKGSCRARTPQTGFTRTRRPRWCCT